MAMQNQFSPLNHIVLWRAPKTEMVLEPCFAIQNLTT